MNLRARSPLRVLATLAIAVVPGLARAQDTSDEAAIRALIEAHAHAWNEADVERAVELYHPDADVRLSGGRELRGREDIVEWHREDLAAYPGSIHSHPPETIAIRFLQPDLAYADVEARLEVRPEGAAEPTLERVMLFIVLAKEDDAWRVVAQRATGPPPGPDR